MLLSTNLKAENTNMMKKLILCSVLVFFFQNVYSSEVIKLGVPLKENSSLYYALSDIYSEAFADFGLTFEPVSCTPIRCATLVSRGYIQGEVGRFSDYSSFYKNMVRVDFVLLKLNKVAITRDSIKVLRSLSEIKGRDYTVGFQLGYRSPTRGLSKVIDQSKLVPEIHWSSAIKHLHDKEIDVFVTAEQMVVPDLTDSDKKGLIIHALDDGIVEIFPFLGKGSEKYSVLLKNSLIKMKSKGRITEILRKYNIPTKL